MTKRSIERSRSVARWILTAGVLFWSAPLLAGQGGATIYWDALKTEGLKRPSRKRFVKAVNAAAKKERVTLSMGWRVEKKECKTLSCRRNRANKAGASWLLTVEVEALGETYITKVTVSAVGKGGLEWVKKNTCEICTLKEACAGLEKVLGKLFAKARLLKGKAVTTRKVHPSPTARPDARGGEKSTGGRAGAGARGGKGGTGLKGEGDGAFRGRGKGAGSKGEVRGGKLLKGVGWILGGASLLGFVPGAVLLAIHGRGTCSGGGECPDVYDTQTGGIVALAAGGACLAAAVTVYVIGVMRDKKKEERPMAHHRSPSWFVTVSPLKGGTALGVSGRF